MFYKFKESDLISSWYIIHAAQSAIQFDTAYSDSYASTTKYRVYDELAEGIQRTYLDSDGTFLTASYNLTGSILLLGNADLSASEKHAINRLRNIYASSSFLKPQNYISSSVFSASNASGEVMKVLNIPSIIYGSQIKPGSLKLVLSDVNLTDDGYGGLYSASLPVGSIFYNHGVVYIGHNASALSYTGFTLHFSSTHKIPINMYLFNLPRGEGNFSNNPSYVVYNTGSNKDEITFSQPTTVVTTITLYDEDFEPIGVCKVSSPILNDEGKPIQFRAKLNF